MRTTIKANNINLYVETFGDRTHPAVLLIMGLGCQCLNWFPYFYEAIVEQGYYVIRFDNRDVGLSTWSDSNDWEKNPYSLDDMAKDTVELLQALGIEKAHIIGASMGGAVAQRVAISYPDRVLSLTSIVSFADALALTRSGISLSLSTKVPSLEEYLGFWSALVGTTFPLDIPLYTQLYKESVQESKRYNPDCMAHQLGAIARSPAPELTKINVPSLILYGTADPLIPSDHAVAYGKLIANSQLVKMAGVGHDIPAGICDVIHPEIFNLFKKSQFTMSNQIEAVRAKFIEYSEVFNDLEPKSIPPFFHLPSMLMTITIGPKVMSTEKEVLDIFTQFMGLLRQQNFTRSEIDNLSEKMLSENTAIVSGSAIRYKKDPTTGVEVELERIGVTYTFRKDASNDWKIIVGIIHNLENAITL